MGRAAPAIEGYQWQMSAPGEISLREAVAFEPGPAEAVVRVVGCGVCHTDLGFLYDGVRPRHELPLALGHEIAGEVVATGEGCAELEGKAVIVPAVTPCGECDACRAGRGPICARQVMPGNDIQGGFASHVVVPARGLCVVSAAGALEGRALAPCGATLAELAVVADAVTTPFQAVQRSGLAEGGVALVVGLGGVGGYAAQIAKARGATVIGFDVAADKLELMRAHGVDLAIDPSAADAKEIKRDLRAFAAERGLPKTGWRIYECSGTGAGQALAWSLMGHDAFLSVVGFTLESVDLRLSNLMAFDATAQGNWGCLPELYPDALELVLEGRVALSPFVEKHPLSEARRVLEDVHERRITRRAVLCP